MARSTMWVKVRAYGPAVLVSTMLTCMVGAVLPGPAGAALFVVGLATTVLLLAGVGEAAAVRTLFRARALTLAEQAALAPAVSLLCGHGLGPPVISLWVRDRVVPISARGVGRRSVIVSGGLVGAVRDGQLPEDQAAAVIAHGAGLVRAGVVRSDAALEFWTLPWWLVRAMACGIARALAWLPLTGLAWRLRFVLGIIALVQAIEAGRPAVGVASAAVIAVTYLVPGWERAWTARLSDVGDRQVLEAGLAPALARFLRRCSGSAATHQRIRSLTGPAQRPQLGLVTGGERLSLST